MWSIEVRNRLQRVLQTNGGMAIKRWVPSSLAGLCEPYLFHRIGAYIMIKTVA